MRKETTLRESERVQNLPQMNFGGNDGDFNEKKSIALHQEVLRTQKIEYQKRKYKDTLRAISFNDPKRYHYGAAVPNVFFYKLMARKEFSPAAYEEVDTAAADLSKRLEVRLKVWVPDTIVFNDQDMQPYWVYSSKEGLVHRLDQINSRMVQSKLAYFTSPDELVAVLKKPSIDKGECVGNDIELLTTKELSLTTQGLFSSREGTSVVQKYVKPIGSKAFVVRAVWRKDNKHYSYVISNKASMYDPEKINESVKFITHPATYGSCTIVETKRGRYIDDTIPYLLNIAKFLWTVLKAKFTEIVGDFIKDESDNWWLINIKAFRLEEPIPNQAIRARMTHPDDVFFQNGGLMSHAGGESKPKPKFYQKFKYCNYCEVEYPVEKLGKKLTLKMIIQLDKHLMVSSNFPRHQKRFKPSDFLVFGRAEQRKEIRLADSLRCQALGHSESL